MQRWPCASCDPPLTPGVAWKQAGKVYCGEFCAEGAELEAPGLMPDWASPEMRAGPPRL